MPYKQRRFREYEVEIVGIVTGTFRIIQNVAADNAEQAARKVRKKIKGQAIDTLNPKVTIGELQASRLRTNTSKPAPIS